MYTLDTNAIIYYLAGDAEVGALIDDFYRRNISLYISTITVTELFSGRNADAEEKDSIENILYSLFSVAVDTALARMGGDIRRVYGLKLADSIIAAALSTDTVLITRNVADFSGISQLKLLKI